MRISLEELQGGIYSMAKEINNMDDLAIALQPVMKKMVDNMANRVYETLNFFLQKYYDSYDPISYRRQYDFLRSGFKVDEIFVQVDETKHYWISNHGRLTNNMRKDKTFFFHKTDSGNPERSVHWTIVTYDIDGTALHEETSPEILVAKHFLIRPTGCNKIWHIDENMNNNYYKNLIYLSAEEYELLRKHVITVADTGKEVVLYVFKGFLNLKKENTTDYYVYVSDIKTNRRFRLLVAYNSTTKKYYISDTQIKRMHKQGVFSNAIFHASNDGSIPLIGVEFHEFSKLAMYGYSAGKNGLSAHDRHRIISYVLDKKIMRKYEIIEHLQGLINLREQRDDKDFSTAI